MLSAKNSNKQKSPDETANGSSLVKTANDDQVKTANGSSNNDKPHEEASYPLRLQKHISKPNKNIQNANKNSSDLLSVTHNTLSNGKDSYENSQDLDAIQFDKILDKIVDSLS